MTGSNRAERLQALREAKRRKLNKEEGKTDAVLIIGQSRFGPLSDSVKAQIERASPEEIQQLLVAATTATSLEAWLSTLKK